MVKRHNPKPPGRRRLAPEAVATTGLPAPAEMMSAPIEPLEEVVTSVSQDVRSSALDPAPLAIAAATQDADDTPAESDIALPRGGLVLVGPSSTDLRPSPASGDIPFVVPIQPRKLAPYVPTPLAAVGTTLQAFVLNEGLAALAHWRALSRSPSPADALRLQVDEMQRAADASLTCLGRIADHLGRIGASKAA